MGNLAIQAIAEYHNDVERSLRLYFSEASPTFRVRFLGLRPEEIVTELASRLEETDQRSAFFILTTLEAAFRVDYERRCKTKVRLDEDIFEAWRENSTGSHQLIGELRGAFKFRHWLAHGRYWEPNLGRKYAFNFVYSLADDVLNALPFQTFE